MRKSLRMLCCALLVVPAAAIAGAPAGFAQSAGDEQYVDPFQPEQGSDGGGGSTGSAGGSGTGGGAPGQPSVPETPAPEPPADTLGAAPSTGSGSAGSAAGEFVLPRTGLPFLALLAAGTLLLGGGWALRRSA